MGSPTTPHDARELMQQMNQRIRTLERRKSRGGGGSIDSAVNITGGEQIGDIVWASAEVRENSLIAHGQAVSRTTYADLNAYYAALGYPHGSGDGSTTFNLPNLSGRVLVGKDTGEAQFDAVGKEPGASTHTLTVDEMPAHQHGLNYSLIATSSGTSAFAPRSSPDDGTTSAPITSTGGGEAHNIVQKSLVENAFVVFAVDAITVSGAASSTPDPSKLMQRDTAGRVQVVDPVVDADVDTKGARDAALVGTWRLLAAVRQTGTISVPSGTNVGVPWGAADYDPLGLFTAGSVNIPVPETGIYRMKASASFQGDSGGIYRILYLQVNGLNSDFMCDLGVMGSLSPRGNVIAGAILLNAGDNVSLEVRHNASNPLDVPGAIKSSMTLEQLIQ